MNFKKNLTFYNNLNNFKIMKTLKVMVNMRKPNCFRNSLAIVTIFLTSLFIASNSFGSIEKFGVGIKAGMSRLEGDWKEPKLGLGSSIYLFYKPVPYISIGGEAGYVSLQTKSDADRISLKYSNSFELSTLVYPISLNAHFQVLQLNKFRLYSLLGFGAVFWNTKYENTSIFRDGKKKTNKYIQFGGYTELSLSKSMALTAGVDFSYTTSDWLDQINSGDENDGIIFAWAGFKYYLLSKQKNDPDDDGILTKCDLDPSFAEDFNGYLDHDGKPEGGLESSGKNKKLTVIHFPVFKMYKGKDLLIKAQINTKNPLRTASVLYRKAGTKSWNVKELEIDKDFVYKAVIDKEFISGDDLEYCVIAVDKQVKNIGYSGLPSRPIHVKVEKKPKLWYTVNSVVTAVSWGTVAYLILRKQNN